MGGRKRKKGGNGREKEKIFRVVRKDTFLKVAA